MKLGIVVPCYNEEQVVPETSARLLEVLDRLIDKQLASEESKIYFVDDGSTDESWNIIESLAADNCRISGIKLSRNCGHQYALLAGLLSAEGDALVSIDADLQDDVSVIEEMVQRHAEAFDIVYGVRRSREVDSGFKRGTAQIYYRLLRLLGVNIVYNHSDYRLMSRRAIEALRRFDEVNLFLRGVVPLIGFRTASVYYDRKERYAGESKYSLRKMLAFAVDGITSFSPVPLRLIALLGFLIFIFSLAMSLWVLWIRLFTDTAVPGWASTLLPLYFLGGIQLLGIGVIGEYIGKIYMESKRRPRYFIEKSV